MSVGIWVLIFFLIYFGTAPFISHLKYQSLKYGKLPKKKDILVFGLGLELV